MVEGSFYYVGVLRVLINILCFFLCLNTRIMFDLFNFIMNIFSLMFNFLVKLVCVNEVCLDAAERWQLSFQDPASPIMEGITHFHNDIMFFIVVIAIFVT